MKFAYIITLISLALLMQWANTAKAYSSSDLQAMMQVGMTQSDNANYDFAATNWELQVVGIWCVIDADSILNGSVCPKPPPRIMMGNTPWADDISGDPKLIDNPSWISYEGTDYEPSSHDLAELNKWQDADQAGLNINADENSNATQADFEWDSTDYKWSNWAAQGDSRVGDCKTMAQAGTTIEYRFIRFWMTTDMAGKKWKYIVTY